MMGGKGVFGLCFGCRRGGLLQDPLVHSRDEHPQVEGAWMPGSGSPGSHHLVSLFLPVRQYADICLFNTAQYKCPVAMEEAE